MRGKHLKLLSYILFILGILFLVNPNLNITGAVIGTELGISSILSFILGLIFVTTGIVILSEAQTLEKRLVEAEKAAIEEGEPIILDTNYLIEASRNEKDYNKLTNFIRYNFDHGQPVIIPKKVLNEIKNLGVNKGEKDRIKLLKEILPKQTVSVGELDKKWDYFKQKYGHLAKDILNQTPKYVSFMYLSDVNKGESMNIERFLNRNFGKLSDAFSREQYKSALQNAERAYLASKNKGKFLREYDIGQADTDILSGALYLQDNPSIIADSAMDKVKIISKDSHLLDSLKIINKDYASKRGKIKITDKIE